MTHKIPPGLTKTALPPAARSPTCQAWTGQMGNVQKCATCISGRGNPRPAWREPPVTTFARRRVRRSFCVAPQA